MLAALSVASDPYGLGRVVGEPGVLPQRAARLDASLPIRPDEMLIDVEDLNVDAASFKQIRESCGGDPLSVVARIQEIVRSRGKMQNPVTGSGGMLLGRVREVGPEHPAHGDPVDVHSHAPDLVDDQRRERQADQRGDALAGLQLAVRGVLGTDLPDAAEEHPARPGHRVLHLPARADDLLDPRHHRQRVAVRGHAILFASGIWARVPDDMPETLVLAALDVSEKALAALADLGVSDVSLRVDATKAVDVLEEVKKATGGALCDLVINCASVPGTEMATILSTRDGGTAIFFSMATSFTAAALGAEGVGKDLTMLLGNGYVPGHADLTLELLRSDTKLRDFFTARYL